MAAPVEKAGVGGKVITAEDKSEAEDALNAQGIIATSATSKKELHRNTKDICVTNLSVTFHGAPILHETELNLNFGNRCVLVLLQLPLSPLLLPFPSTHRPSQGTPSSAATARASPRS